MIELEEAEVAAEERQLAGSGIRAHYVTERFTYPRSNDTADLSSEGASPVSVRIRLVTTTVGGGLVSKDHDHTGVMLWPASHLMCQHLVQHDIVRRDQHEGAIFAEKVNVLELGCGCGIVSLVGIMCHSQNEGLWMATDINDVALELCRENFVQHGFDGNSGRARVRSLAWGDDQRLKDLKRELKSFHGGDAEWHYVLGADIVYPDTNNETLTALFRTVDRLLTRNGTFYLAFATRDGPRTPSRLVQAAHDAGFTIDRLPPLAASTVEKLPPLLDSKLLVFRKRCTSNDQDIQQIGTETCNIFPGLWRHLAKVEASSSDEEWQAPFASSSEED